jgi:hypothetical protein
MPQVLVTPQVETDLLEIWVYLAEESTIATADRVLGTIDQKCQALAEQPGRAGAATNSRPVCGACPWATMSCSLATGRRASGCSVPSRESAGVREVM